MPTMSRTHKNRGFPLMKNPPCKTASRFLMCWNSTTNSRRVASIADSGAKCYAKRRNLRDFRKKRRFVSIFHPQNLHFAHRTTAFLRTGTATSGRGGSVTSATARPAVSAGAPFALGWLAPITFVGNLQTQAITLYAKGYKSTASGILGVDESWTITAN